MYHFFGKPIFVSVSTLCIISFIAIVSPYCIDFFSASATTNGIITLDANHRKNVQRPFPSEKNTLIAAQANSTSDRNSSPNYETKTIPLTNLPSDAQKLVMVKIPHGSFRMGSPTSELNRYFDEAQFEVRLTNDFYIGMYEITQAQWKAVMGNNPSKSKGANLPVEQVSWNDCQTFIQKLNTKGYGNFRLPSEAEWEYACRAGTSTTFYWGNDSNYDFIKKYAWYSNNSGNRTHEVGLKLPNSFGLYDMCGNTWEWCQDLYGSYPTGIFENPKGTINGSYRVLRGGCWFILARDCRSATRLFGNPDDKNPGLGFRLALSL